MRLFTNPSILFSFVWILVLFLYSLEYSLILTKINIETIVLLIGCSLSAMTAWLTSSLFQGNKLYLYPIQISGNWNPSVKKIIMGRLKIIFIIWLTGVLFELLFFQNLPILSLFNIGKNIQYYEYGFSGLHGLLNAIQMVLFSMLILAYIRGCGKKFLLYAFFLLIWSAALVTRGIIMSCFIQGFFIFALFSDAFRKKFFILAIILLISTIIGFGFLGDLRSSGGAPIEEIALQSADYPSYLPSGFFWIYVYLTSPINNINANIQSISGNGYPLYSILPLLPNIVKAYLNVDDPDIDLVTGNLNVSSFFRQFLLDYGISGTIFVVFFLYTGFSLVVRKAIKNEMWSLVLVVILYCTVMSVFVNSYTAIVQVAQVLVIMWLYRRNLSNCTSIVSAK